MTKVNVNLSSPEPRGRGLVLRGHSIKCIKGGGR